MPDFRRGGFDPAQIRGGFRGNFRARAHRGLDPRAALWDW